MHQFRICPSQPAFLRLFAGLLVMLIGATPALAESEGLMPSLDSEPAPAESTMTPITELIGQPDNETENKNVAANAAPAQTDAQQNPTQPAEKKTSSAKPVKTETKPASNTNQNPGVEAKAGPKKAEQTPAKATSQPEKAVAKAASPQSEKNTAKAANPQPEKAAVKAEPNAKDKPLAAKPVAKTAETKLESKVQPKAEAHKKPVEKQTVGRIHPADLTPLLDQTETSQVSQTSGLRPLQETADQGHSSASDHQALSAQQPMLDDEPALTPLQPAMGGDQLTPLHPAAADSTLTPLQPAEGTAELTPLQPEATQPALEPNPETTSSEADGPPLKGAKGKHAGRKPLAAKASVKTTPQKPRLEPTTTLQTETTKTEDKPVASQPVPAEKAEAPARKPFKFSMDVGQAIQNAKQTFTNGEKAIQPVSYTELPGIAVFAVVKHGNDRAFGDLPVIFAREYAQQLGVKLPKTKIYNPIYTVDELRMQGLGHIYDQIMGYYIKTGAPEPTATDYLLKQISTNRPTISRVIFIEADLDMSHPDASTNLLDRTKQLLVDDQPKHMKYFVISHVQIFDAEKPGYPLVWAGNWQRSILTNKFYNVTPSVYTDSDSQQAFAKVSRQMSQELIYVTPKNAYMAPNFDTDVEGKLVSGKQQPAFQNTPDSQTSPNGLSHENKQAIERILQRQNDMSPR